MKREFRFAGIAMLGLMLAAWQCPGVTIQVGAPTEPTHDPGLALYVADMLDILADLTDRGKEIQDWYTAASANIQNLSLDEAVAIDREFGTRYVALYDEVLARWAALQPPSRAQDFHRRFGECFTQSRGLTIQGVEAIDRRDFAEFNRAIADGLRLFEYCLVPLIEDLDRLKKASL